MDYFDDARELVKHSEESLEKILKSYDESLHEMTIKKTLLIEIKNLMENLRSALDFTAHGLFDLYGDTSRASDKIYFPYASETLDSTGFTSKRIIDNKIPGLATNRPDIASKIESYQHFADSSNKWLPKFMDLNNENKHQNLTPQTRRETKQLTISSGGASISLGQGASISLGKGASISIGGVKIPGGQTFDSNNPAKITGQGTQEVITWVSFHFTTNDEPVIPLLKNALSGTKKIVDELTSM